ncbi:MAG TPA: SDR family oxidoreductase, partial [Acidimicrobiales bacterium]|nr:SDR family oxidoreductase [Acidimicrobiales bacterium]
AAALPGNFVALSGDVSQLDELERLVDDASNGALITDVVHAAGVQVRKAAVEVTPSDWQAIARVNLEGPFFLSTSVARRQLDAGEPGSHVFVASLGTSLGIRHIAPYVATKSGVMGIVRTLALEWATAGIRVNAIAPGYFETSLTSDLLADPGQRARVISRIAMGRLGIPDDLAGATIFLLSQASTYVTGQLLNVDGGWLAG